MTTTPEALYRGKRVTVVGGARSGLAVARLLAGVGATVFLSDKGSPANMPNLVAELERAGVKSEFGGHTAAVLDCDLAVISPGVPSNVPVVKQLVAVGRPVLSEIEVASQFCRAPIVAITGTNGKTTTTSLIGRIFRDAGRQTVVAGNIGLPFSDYAAELSPDGVAVLEVSSFQLDHIEAFRPKVGVLLNITPDHLDRYPTFNDYVLSKFRLFKNATADDFLVYNADDEYIRPFVEQPGRVAATLLPFSTQRELAVGAFVRGGEVIIHLPSGPEERLMAAGEIRIRGAHNLYNSLAAALAGRAMEIKNETLRESLTGFEGVAHRLEFVRDLGGVKYVNDSKATNVNSVWYALESFDEPIILIAGGRDKGNDYAILRELVRRKVKALVSIGEGAEKLEAELGSLTRTVRARSMEDATRIAQEMADPGDVVLLSPACASFDMFDNYEHRGETFKRLVANL